MKKLKSSKLVAFAMALLMVFMMYTPTAKAIDVGNGIDVSFQGSYIVVKSNKQMNAYTKLFDWKLTSSDPCLKPTLIQPMSARDSKGESLLASEYADETYRSSGTTYLMQNSGSFVAYIPFVDEAECFTINENRAKTERIPDAITVTLSVNGHEIHTVKVANTEVGKNQMTMLSDDLQHLFLRSYGLVAYSGQSDATRNRVMMSETLYVRPNVHGEPKDIRNIDFVFQKPDLLSADFANAADARAMIYKAPKLGVSAYDSTDPNVALPLELQYSDSDGAHYKLKQTAPAGFWQPDTAYSVIFVSGLLNSSQYKLDAQQGKPIIANATVKPAKTMYMVNTANAKSLKNAATTVELAPAYYPTGANTTPRI